MKRIWENAVGKTLREVLEATYEKKAEEITVDNEELSWYQGNLDEEIIEVLRSPEGDSEALITENLAWVDCPTQIHVYNSQTRSDPFPSFSFRESAKKTEMELVAVLKRIDKYLSQSVDVSRLRTAKTATPLTDRLATVTLNGDAIDMDIVAHYMDDDIREDLHMELAPCDPQVFVDAYCAAHYKVYEEEFAI